jgi:hypothetical protein
MEQIANLPDLSGYWKYGELVVPFKLDFAPQEVIAEGFTPRESLTPASKNPQSEAGKEQPPAGAGGETEMRLKPDEGRAVSQSLEE